MSNNTMEVTLEELLLACKKAASEPGPTGSDTLAYAQAYATLRSMR